MKLKSFTLLLLPLSLALTAHAEPQSVDEVSKNVISFGTEVSKEVDYDVMAVTLFIKEENKSLKALNQTINEKVNAALDVIKKQSAVEIKKNARNTQVRYDDKGKQAGWAELAEVMQKRSKEATAKFEDEMMKSALAQFQHKAQLIQTSLNAKGYEILNLNLDSRNELPYFEGRMMPLAKASAFASENADEVNLDSHSKAELKATVSAQIKLFN